MNNSSNYSYQPTMTDDQKRKMYSAIKKNEIIEMLIEANKHIDMLVNDRGVVTIYGGETVRMWETLCLKDDRL